MRLKFFGRFCFCFTLIHVNIVVYAGLFTNTYTRGEADVELTSLLHATLFLLLWWGDTCGVLSVDVCIVYHAFATVCFRGFLLFLLVDASFSLTWIVLIDYRWIYFG